MLDCRIADGHRRRHGSDRCRGDAGTKDGRVVTSGFIDVHTRYGARTIGAAAITPSTTDAERAEFGLAPGGGS